MEQCKILVMDKQIYNTHEEENKVSYEALLAEKDSAVYVIFNERGQNIKTTIKIRDNIVCVKRQGSMNVYLQFKEGQDFHTFYPTDFGNMDLTFKTTKVEINRNLSHFMLKLHYELWMQGSKISDNIYSIERV